MLQKLLLLVLLGACTARDDPVLNLTGCSQVTCGIGFLFICASPAAGLLGVSAIAAMAAHGLPAPCRPTAMPTSPRPAGVASILSTAGEAAVGLALSPCGLLLGAASTMGSGGAVDALEAALGAAELHAALPYAFGCTFCCVGPCVYRHAPAAIGKACG